MKLKTHFVKPYKIKGFIFTPECSEHKFAVGGFTLVEVFIVILVLGVIVGGAFSALLVLEPSLQLSSLGRNITTDLRYAQQMAVSEQVSYGVLFSTTTPGYKILRHGTSTEQIAEKLLPSEVSFQQIIGLTNQEVIFNPYGAVQDSGMVSLINIKGQQKVIEIRPSGFVKIQD